MMKQFFRRALLLLLVCAMLGLVGCSGRTFLPLSILPSPEEEEEKNVITAEAFQGLGIREPEGFVFSGRVFLAGDSTVTGAYSDYRVEQQDLMGWGKYLSYYLKPEAKEFGVDGVTTYNVAMSGASARTFVDTDNYASLMRSLGKGDYLFVQFGHNDQRVADLRVGAYADLAREDVSPETGMDENGHCSFEWVLYHKYVVPAQERGAVVIFVSPNVLRDKETGGPDESGHMPYREVMKNLCEELSLPFVDLTEASRRYYDQLIAEKGPTGTQRLHAFADLQASVIDPTHLSRYGAYCVAGLVAGEVSRAEIALSNFVIEPQKTISPRT